MGETGETGERWGKDTSRRFKIPSPPFFDSKNPFILLLLHPKTEPDPKKIKKYKALEANDLQREKNSKNFIAATK